jgi:hypothetical protein
VTSRKEKKEIKRVLAKYVDINRGKKKLAVTSAAYFCILLPIDAILFGGLGTAALVCSAGSTGFYGLLNYTGDRFKTLGNTAGQKIKDRSVYYTGPALQEMESRLQKAFKKAAAPKAPADEKVAFMRLAAEIEQDAKTLAPTFKIVSGGPHGFGTDKYEFIMAEIMEVPGQKKLISLTEALKQIQIQPQPKTEKPERRAPEKEDQNLLKKYQEALDTIKGIKKKPNDGPTPN